MNRITGKKLILLSVFIWIIIAVGLPMFTSFGISEIGDSALEVLGD